jgi:hypothetical protein
LAWLRWHMGNGLQVALTYPPFDHRPGGHHLDGATPPEPDGRPETCGQITSLLVRRVKASQPGSTGSQNVATR